MAQHASRKTSTKSCRLCKKTLSLDRDTTNSPSGALNELERCTLQMGETDHRIPRHFRKLRGELYKILFGVGMLGTQLVLGSWSKVEVKMDGAKCMVILEEYSLQCARDASLRWRVTFRHKTPGNTAKHTLEGFKTKSV